MNETISKEIKGKFIKEYDKLKKKSDDETKGVIVLLTTAFVLSFIFMCIGGYLTYKNYTRTNEIETIGKGD